NLWMFTGEMFTVAAYEEVDVVLIKDEWLQKVQAVFDEATLDVPKDTWTQNGGKEGRHTEHLGYLLAEMQYLQRVYPNSTW
ncbi:MAG TPA: Phenylacetic acid catabolic protein, partial [Flavisolibacter sp.]